jgi:hypothetical protein
MPSRYVYQQQMNVKTAKASKSQIMHLKTKRMNYVTMKRPNVMLSM